MPLPVFRTQDEWPDWYEQFRQMNAAFNLPILEEETEKDWRDFLVLIFLSSPNLSMPYPHKNLYTEDRAGFFKWLSAAQLTWTELKPV